MTSRAAIQPTIYASTPLLGSAYPVSLPVFEGPLDLLLHLIEREELDISEVSLLMVTDQYLKTLAQLEEIEAGALADFLVVASRLLYIKSSRLLPQRLPAGDEDEEESADALIRHLLEFRQYKRVAATLKLREEEGVHVYGRGNVALDVSALTQRPPDFGEIDISRLQVALRRALQRMPADPPMPKVQTYAITVAEQIETVRRMVREVLDHQMGREEGIQIAFTNLLGDSYSRLEVIVTFLAVLELVKQRELQAMQVDTFGEIILFPATGVTNLDQSNEPADSFAEP